MEQNNENNQKHTSSKEVVAFLKTTRGKAFLFFGIYILLFLVLGVVSRISGTNGTIGSNIKVNPYSYSMNSILNKNFQFQYQYQIDGVSTTFTGKQLDEKVLFNDGVTNFYQNDTLFMRNQDGIWVRTDNPYVFPSFLDPNVIENLISLSTYISKTELASGEEEINFQITTTTLVRQLDSIDVDLDDPVNTIQLKTDSNGEVVQIVYDLTSYAIYHGRSSQQFLLTLSYSNFGEIENIEDPA